MVKIDNISNTYFKTSNKLTGKKVRWVDFIAKYDVEFRCKLGKENSISDALSHKPQFKGEGEGSQELTLAQVGEKPP